MKKNYLLFALFAMLFSYATPIITKWNTNANSDNSTEINIRATGEFTYTYVKTTDSSVTGSGSGNGSTWSNVITFPSIGEYIVRITPVSFFSFVNGSNFGNDNKKFIELQQWGTTIWNTNLSGMFYGCSNLVITATDIPNFSNVTNMSSMFYGCYSLSTVPNMNCWDVSNVTDMSYMFGGGGNVGFYSPFNENIEDWDVHNVKNMRGMFSVTSAFNQNIGNWDVHNVTNMQSMFSYALAFNQNIGNWDVQNVTNMRGMFTYTSNFNQNIGDWDVHNVTTMLGMFGGASVFNQNLGNWNISNVTDMKYMFKNAVNFNQNLGKWTLNSNTDLIEILDNSGLNCENYSKTLYGWATNPNCPANRKLSASGRNYGPDGLVYRNKLINQKGWTFSGDTFDSGCFVNLSTKDITKSNEIRIFPNPTKDIFYINSKNNENIFIYNSSGQFLRKETIEVGDNKIDISAIANGIYFLKQENNTYKLIKE